jgi:hypothetical protein
MDVKTIFKTYGELWSDVEYGENGWDFHDRNPSDRRRGVYAFVSRFGIEKVGKIENKMGVSARSYGYISSKRRIELGKNDASDALWDNVMTSELSGEILEFYFIPLESHETEICGVLVETAPIRPLEHKLSTMARAEGHPMRLSGAGN